MSHASIPLACMAGLAAVLAAAAPAHAGTLSDNTASASAGTLAVDAANLLAASFGSGSTSGAVSLTATLLGSTTSGSATLSLYGSDASGLVPDAALAGFTAVSASDGSLVFTLSGVTLQADTGYWLVLSNAGGTSDWSWTEENSGSGAGYTGVWANSDDAGATWFSNSALYPQQFSVVATAVPEPSTTVLLLSAVPLLAAARLRRG